MAAKSVSKPTRRKGSERVKAWVYSALNPVLEALQADTILLSKKNITWRYSSEEMEFILPTRDLISPTARPNYDDILRGYRVLKPHIEERDNKVEALLEDARHCWRELTLLSFNSPLRHAVEGHLKQWREEGNLYPGGAIPEEEFWLLIAEHVMNDAADLPFHYTNRLFWSRFRRSFLAFRTGQSFSQLEKSIAELKKSDEELIETLDRARSKLCEEYDIPAAPI